MEAYKEAHISETMFKQALCIFTALAHWAYSVIESLCPSVSCIYVVCGVPFPCIFFKASHWRSDHMISSRPLINQPFFPTVLSPLPTLPQIVEKNLPTPFATFSRPDLSLS